MDPTWVAIIVGVASSVITGAFVAIVHHFALKVLVAKLQTNHENLAARCEEDRALLAMTKEVHDKRLGTHELEIGLLKRTRPEFGH